MRYFSLVLFASLVTAFVTNVPFAFAANPSLLLHYDYSFDDTSGNSFQSARVKKSDGSIYPLPTLTTLQKKFGGASADFTAINDTALGYNLATTGPLSLGTQDFTLDFWMYPKSRQTAVITVYPMFLISQKTAGNEVGFLYGHNKLTHANGGWTWFNDYFPNFQFTRNGATEVNRPGAYSSEWVYGNTIYRNISDYLLITNGRWNHVVLIRRGGYIGVGVNGKIFWNSISPSFTITLPDSLLFGVKTSGSNTSSYDGYLDEARLVIGESLFANANPSLPAKPSFLPNGAYLYSMTPLTYVSTYTIPTTPVTGPDDFAISATPSRGGVLTQVLTEITAPSGEIFDPSEGVQAPVSTSTTKTFYRSDGNPLYDYDFVGDIENQKPSAIRFYASDGATKTGDQSYDNGLLSRETFFAPDGVTVAESRLFYMGGKPRKEIIRRNGAERYNRYLENGTLAYSHVYNLASRVYDGVRTWVYNANNKPTEELLYYSADRYEKRLLTYDGAGALTQIERFVRVPQNTQNPYYFYTLSRFTNGKPSFERTVAAGTYSGQFQIETIEDITYSQSGLRTRGELFDFVNDRMFLTTFTAEGKRTRMHAWVQSSGAYLSKTDYEYDSDGNLAKEKTLRFLNGFAVLPYDRYDITVYAPTGEKKETYSYTYYDLASGTVLRPKDMDVKRYDPATGGTFMHYLWTFADADPITVTSYKGYDKNNILVMECLNFTGMKPSKCVYTNSAGDIYAESEYTYENATDYVLSTYVVYSGTRVLKKAERYRMPDLAKPYPQASDTKLGVVSEDKLAETKVGDLVLTSLGITPSSVSTSNEQDALYRLTKGILEKYQQRIISIGSGVDQKPFRFAAYIDLVRDLQNGLYAIEYRAWGPTKGWNNTQQLTFEVGGSWIGTDETNGEEFWGAYFIPGGGARYDSSNTAFIDMSDVSTVGRVLEQTSYSGLAALPKRKEKWDSFRGGNNIVLNSAEGGKLYYWNVLANNGAGGYLSTSERVKEDPSVNLLLDSMLADFKKDGVDLKTLDTKTVLRKFYLYMYDKSLITYIGDAGDTNQLPSETLERGGGDCDDNATLTLSLTYNLLLRLEKYDEANRLGFMLGLADKDTLSASNYGIGHAAAGYLDVDGTYYIMDGAPLYMGLAKQKPITEAEALPALSSGSIKTGFIKAADWNFAAEAFSLVNGGTTFFASPRGVNPYTAGDLPQAPVQNTSAYIGEIDRYIEPFNWRVEAIAKHFVEFIPRMSEKSVNDLVEITHDYFRDIVSYRSDTGDSWSLVSATLGNAVRGGKVIGNAVGDGEDLAFVEASILERILYDYYLSQGTFEPLALEKARQRIVLVGKKSGTNTAQLLVGLVLPTEDELYTRVRLIDPRAESIGPVQFYADLFDTTQYLFVVTKDGPTAISHTNWDTLVLQ